MSVTYPAAGQLHKFSTLSGYRLVQDRPFNCRPACTCGECNGRSTTTTEEVREVIFWADNSVEVVSVTGRVARLRAPYGDAC